jgi:hypothetical protein
LYSKKSRICGGLKVIVRIFHEQGLLKGAVQEEWREGTLIAYTVLASSRVIDI